MGEILKNNETSVKKDCTMNEEDILNDVLLSFKHLVSSLAIALNEASCKEVYKVYFDLFEKSSKLQAEIFETQFRNGWYQLEKAEETKIEKTYKKFTDKLCELSCDCEKDN